MVSNSLRAHLCYWTGAYAVLLLTLIDAEAGLKQKTSVSAKSEENIQNRTIGVALTSP